jgi:hypothetical protein
MAHDGHIKMISDSDVPEMLEFQAILRRWSVAVTQESYTMGEAVDPQPPSGRCKSSSSDYATNLQLGWLNASMSFL